jgi:hypothetical protein
MGSYLDYVDEDPYTFYTEKRREPATQRRS